MSPALVCRLVGSDSNGVRLKRRLNKSMVKNCVISRSILVLCEHSVRMRAVEVACVIDIGSEIGNSIIL